MQGESWAVTGANRTRACRLSYPPIDGGARAAHRPGRPPLGRTRAHPPRRCAQKHASAPPPELPRCILSNKTPTFNKTTHHRHQQIKRIRNLRTTSGAAGPFDVYVVATLGAARHRTRVERSLEPEFHEQVVFDAASLERGGAVVTFEVWDANVFADELVSERRIRRWGEGEKATRFGILLAATSRA